MALFKCKMCGGTLEIKNETVAECEYCGTQQTLPKLDDERRANLYDRANHFRRNNEFDKAMVIYEQILNEDNTDAESYWSLVLCRYGIEYVEDPSTHKRVPTVNRAQFTSIFDDDNYKAALSHADGYQKTIYEAEARAINEIQKAYLTFEHDEFTMKPTLDENGRLIPREGYRIATLNCGDEDFAIASMRANFRYGKNQQRGDVKSHHYIISFDPRDAPDHGLTVDRAQQLGEDFCSAHFPGHQAIVCTHPDGHNHSGNIHVHIVINSLRIAEVPFLPYMDRPCDTQPGMKHRCTNAAMEYFRGEVMEMCHAAGLYQIDLFNSKERVSEREYWAKKKGQLALDEENAVLAEQGLPVKQTKFETDKDKLRKQIRSVLSVSVSYEDFAEKLLQLGITVKESRGRLSYLTPDRTKPITARKLGDDFDKTAVLAALDQNAQRAKVQTAPKRSTQVHSHQPEAVSRMVDVEAKRAEGKGQAYLHWAKIHNLKNASKAYLLYQEMGFSSPEELDAAYQETHTRLDTVRNELKSIETVIAEKKELQRHVLNYLKTKDTREGLKACKSEKARKAYKAEHEGDFILLDAAKKYFDSKELKKLPGYKTLQKEIEQLIVDKNELYNEYYTLKEKDKELGTVRHNVYQILNGALTRNQEQNKKQTQEQEI